MSNTPPLSATQTTCRLCQRYACASTMGTEITSPPTAMDRRRWSPNRPLSDRRALPIRVQNPYNKWLLYRDATEKRISSDKPLTASLSLKAILKAGRS
jgi:hypothetical protein